ncbi:MAG: hypothetical protein LBJ01_00500 [Tannerella sp.]|jgi:hypothetical protein|nr:hypothetical protein [Tannerella sp.]
MNYQVLINAIKVGIIASDGGVATSFAALGNTRKDTLSFNTTAPTFQKIMVEERDTPILNVMTDPGGLQMQWALTDWDADILTALWGGTVVDEQWLEPAILPTVEKSLRIEPRQGKPFIYPRVQLTAQIQYDTTGKIFQIQVTADKLQPMKAGTPAFMWGDPEE